MPVVSGNHKLPKLLKNWRASLLIGPWYSTAMGTHYYHYYYYYYQRCYQFCNSNYMKTNFFNSSSLISIFKLYCFIELKVPLNPNQSVDLFVCWQTDVFNIDQSRECVHSLFRCETFRLPSVAPPNKIGHDRSALQKRAFWHLFI